MWTYPAWTYPEESYCYGWYDTRPSMPTDGDIKSMVVLGLAVSGVALFALQRLSWATAEGGARSSRPAPSPR